MLTYPERGAPDAEFKKLLKQGWQYLAEGTGRMVLKRPEHDDWVIKVNLHPCPHHIPIDMISGLGPGHPCYGANHLEIEEWKREESDGRDSSTSFLAEILTWSESRKYLVMEYVRDLNCAPSTHFHHRYTDLKPDNFGITSDGREKLRDYTEIKDDETLTSPYV